MTASEIAFLAFGLLLGATGGAAAAAVSRARGRPAREIRVTVAPAALPSRPATLATYLAVADPPPAPGGPGDPLELGLAPADDRAETRPQDGGSHVDAAIERPAPRLRTGTTPGDPVGSSLRTPVLVRVAAPPSSLPSAARPPERRPRAVPIGGGRDPLLDEILGRRPNDQIATTATASVAEAASPVRATTGRAEPSAGARGAGVQGAGEIQSAGVQGAGEIQSAGALAAVALAGDAPVPSERAAPPPHDSDLDPGRTDPCADARLLTRERCAVAERAKAEAAAAAERLRAARRAYDDAVAKADAAAAAADPRAVRAAKEAAQDAFRVARSTARSRAEAEAAARAWLEAINRINREAAAAEREAARLAAVVADLGPELERLSTEADAARILAESAEEACLAARQALADCEEKRAALERASQGARSGEDRTGAPPEPTFSGGQGPGGSEPGPPEPAFPMAAFEDDTAALVGERDREAAIIRLLRGDHRVLDRIVARLAGSDPEEERRWRLLLADLVDAIIARAIEANALDFPDDDPFWGRFTTAQARDIAAALASLGYRFDGLGGFVDGRVPSQRDLSLAVGYAGLDPMRIRTWPSEAELATLFERVTIAADEFLIREAGGLTLSELVELLGHRADELADIWNAWGRLRPLLLELA